MPDLILPSHPTRTIDKTNAVERAVSPELDEVLGWTFPILDHGHIRVVDYMGSDAAIVQAARVSYGAGTRTLRGDRGLIRYLVRHRHTSPLEQCSIKFHLKMPMFVARQQIRHRTASLNEISARYSVLKHEYYIPEASRVQVQSSDNKQGSGEALALEEAEKARRIMEEATKQGLDAYDMLMGENDLARELARCVLPVNMYTEMYWKMDLHNLLHYLSLRNHPHAQYEIRVFAQAMHQILEMWVPHTVEAFTDYNKTAHTFSGPEMEALKKVVAGETPEQATEGAKMSKREKAAFAKALGAGSGR